MLEQIILGSLTIREMSGYEIKKLMSYSTAFFSNVSFGSIYPTLKRFEDSGLVISKEVIENGRFKKVYEITEEGRRNFHDWLEEPLKPFIFKYEMLVRIFFAGNMPKDKFTGLIKQHIEQIREIDSTLEQIDQGPGQTGDKYQQLTLRFGRDFYAFIIQWYEQLLDEIRGSIRIEQIAENSQAYDRSEDQGVRKARD
ncbi:MAG: PadR family transcriptional regulator [Acidobacteriota bacterium]